MFDAKNDAGWQWLLFKPLTNDWLHLRIWCKFLPS